MNPQPDISPPAVVSDLGPARGWDLIEAMRLRNTRSNAFFWTRNVNHRIGAGLSVLLLETRVSPNAVSVVSVLMYAPLALYVGSLHPPAGLLSGLLLFFWLQVAYTLDCTDGQLARARGQSSPFGGWLDRTFDFCGHTALVTALLLYTVRALHLEATTSVLFTGYVLGAHLTQMFASFYRTAVIGTVPAAGSSPGPLLSWLMAGMQITDYGIFILAVALTLAFPFALAVVLLAYATLAVLMLLGQLALNWRREVQSGRSHSETRT
jgi:phosphatidylglycerophosphate synthase